MRTGTRKRHRPNVRASRHTRSPRARGLAARVHRDERRTSVRAKAKLSRESQLLEVMGDELARVPDVLHHAPARLHCVSFLDRLEDGVVLLDVLLQQP
jgi:hypothetical protein